ncbi:MAG: 3-phosphoshikimate 1-carboxyvinyltransferase [Actinobacteria bacterium]|nr:3-phosphoshikimate 1-carboxyvinyltransferase [Actinomycetota bacterium]
MEIYGINHLNGNIKAPPDKSISHRSAIISALSNQDVFIENFLMSEDCLKTLEVLTCLGVEIEKENSNLIIKGKGIKSFREPETVLYVGNSGTTIRLMSGVLSACNFMSVLSGDSSINSRPMERIIEPLSGMGASIYGRSKNSRAPLVIIGNSELKGKKFNMGISSAQVKSCLALAGLYAEGKTEIIQPAVSRDHTERMLEYFGADIKYDGRHTKIIPGKELTARNIYIPGDISSAAFIIVATMILKNSHTVLSDVGINPTRSFLLEILSEMGGNLKIKNKKIAGNEPMADIEVFSSRLRAVSIDKSMIPNIIDEIPILCVAAAMADGTSYIRGAQELRHKESDRIAAISNQFSAMGVEIAEEPDGLIINGNRNLKVRGGIVQSMGDHRIAMSLAVLAMLSEEKVTVMDSDCINTSFPSFKYIIKKLAG